jgi:hypothetical protein
MRIHGNFRCEEFRSFVGSERVVLTLSCTSNMLSVAIIVIRAHISERNKTSPPK